MQQLSWQQFDDAVARLAERFEDESIHGIYGIPRGGLCLAVALSHAMEQPFLLRLAGCLVGMRCTRRARPWLCGSSAPMLSLQCG